MKSYILKNTKKKEKVLLYQEKKGYSFTPRKAYYRVQKITVLDDNMISSILKGKIMNKYQRLYRIVRSILEDDDTTTGDILVALNETERLKQMLLVKYAKYLNKKMVEKYIGKIEILERSLQKKIQEEAFLEKSGRGR